MARPKGSNSNARERLLQAAGRGFRTGGFGGAGVDGLAKEAGLTSGAFYSYFDSKNDAFRLVLHEGFEIFQRGITIMREKHGENWVPALIDFYFTERMEAALCDACVLPSLTADAMRADDEIRLEYQKDLQKLAEALASGLNGDLARAWRLLALFAGGAALARTVKDEKIRTEIVQAIRAAAHQV